MIPVSNRWMNAIQLHRLQAIRHPMYARVLFGEIDPTARADATITIPAGQIPDYGMRALFAAGELENVSYGSVFGVDCGELVFDTGKPGKNLLVMGDSYDNAIVKPLAASFAKTYCVDLRSYEGELGRPFDLESYLRGKEIDAVLFVGAIDYCGGTLPREGGR